MMLRGQQIGAGCGLATVLPEMDFETYSEAGFIWNEKTQSYNAPKGATQKGISAVGAVAYSEHPSAEALCLSYDLKDGLGPRLWVLGMPGPTELFEYIATGGLIEAVNCQFEYWIWKNICVPKLGWPDLPWYQLRDAAAKFRANAWPGALGKAAVVSGAVEQKLETGDRLIKKFGCPRKPTKKDVRKRIRPEDDPADAQLYYEYCIGDIKAESAVSMLCPDLSPEEQEFELCTRASNVRGIGLDMQTIHAASGILDQAFDKYDVELCALTSGAVSKASELDKLKKWLEQFGIIAPELDADVIGKLLDSAGLHPAARRALEIRQLVGSAGVKKIWAMERMASKAGRAHDLIVYHTARTGRDGGRDIQPQNLVKQGPKVKLCEGCGYIYGIMLTYCPNCNAPDIVAQVKGWSYEAVPNAVEVIRTGRLEEVERVYGDALLTLSGCIRGLFVPAEGCDFIASDYASVEAVVTAVLSGERWRIEAFRNKEDIYLRSASSITGTPYEEYLKHPDGPKGHPDRQKIGKPAELGLGFGGYLGAWRQFDSTDTFSDEEVKRNILAWRAASPAVVEFWGGQVRGVPWDPDRHELYGLEGMAIAAAQYPGQIFTYRDISYGVKDDALYCRLPSGRLITYHKPRLSPHRRWDDRLELSFEGWNTNPKKGPTGWIRMGTYGGSLCENVVQATARDIMRHAVVNLERAGYPVILRVHDEIVAEVPKGFGSVEDFERIMGTMPAWAKYWPVRAAGGWRGSRYRKD